jgi:hypothetical protein
MTDKINNMVKVAITASWHLKQVSAKKQTFLNAAGIIKFVHHYPSKKIHHEKHCS